MVTAVPFAMRDHFDKVLQKMSALSLKTSSELTIFLKFIDVVTNIGMSFERSLFKACEEFQFSMKEQVSDERVAHYFQLLINSLLRYGDIVHRVNEAFKEQRTSVSEVAKNTKAYHANMGQVVTATTTEYRTVLQRFETDYRKYIRSQIAYASVNSQKDLSPLPKKPNMLEVTEFINSTKQEEIALKSCKELNGSLDKNFGCLKQKLGNLAALELENKVSIKHSTQLMLNALKAVHAKDPNATEPLLDDPNSEYRSEYKALLREAALDFNTHITYNEIDLPFVHYSIFLKINYVFENNSSRAVYQKVAKLSPEITPRVRLYVEQFFNYFYLLSVEFSKEIIEELNILMANKRTRDYFIYSMILKKCLLFYMRPFSAITLRREQFRNLQPVSQYLFLNYLNLDDIDFELIYYFLKFAASAFSEQKSCFIETCLKIVVFYEVDFWKKLFEWIWGSVYQKAGPNKPVTKEQFDEQFFSSIKSLMKSMRTQTDNERQDSAMKAFDEVVGLLFKLKLDFETITDILILISQRADISMEYVKMLLIRNQDLLMSQISGQALIQCDFRDDPILRFKNLSRPVKRRKVFKSVMPYFSSAKDVLNLLLVNRETYALRKTLLDRYLLTHKFPINSPLRREILAIRLDKETSLTKLPSYARDPNNIICLDVQRTFSQYPLFNPDAIERILNAISSNQYGKFSYYQGLNYVVTYFYVIFRGDEVRTYNFVLTMINHDFSGYIDSELRNLKKLFYYLKKFLKNNLPALQTSLENEHKIDTDIVFASWCLTLFTTVTQYTDHSILLDEIIDIFLGEGWTGFFKVALVILEQMQERLLRMSYEEILMTLSELSKSDFRDLFVLSNGSGAGEPGSPKSARPHDFSFKDRIKKYKHIRKNMMMYYQIEFHKMMEKIDEIWHKINRKIKSKREIS